MRLDQFLVDQNFSRSRTQASDLIKAGKVKVLIGGSWEVIKKPSYHCAPETKVDVSLDEEFIWVSRSGEKLNSALKKLNLSIKDLEVIDLGQSTGGFSECCLKHNAKKVVGVDVGHEQLSEKLKDHPKLQSFEGLDVRKLKDYDGFLEQSFDFMVADLSFISITKIFCEVQFLLKKGARGLILIKPQFELEKSLLSKGGLVKKQAYYLESERKIFKFFNELDQISIKDYFPSGVRGKDGNQEFFLFFEISK